MATAKTISDVIVESTNTIKGILDECIQSGEMDAPRPGRHILNIEDRFDPDVDKLMKAISEIILKWHSEPGGELCRFSYNFFANAVEEAYRNESYESLLQLEKTVLSDIGSLFFHFDFDDEGVQYEYNALEDRTDILKLDDFLEEVKALYNKCPRMFVAVRLGIEGLYREYDMMRKMIKKSKEKRVE